MGKALTVSSLSLLQCMSKITLCGGLSPKLRRTLLTCSEAFGRDTVVKFEGTAGTIQLDAGVVLKVAGLEVDGVPLPGGTYGGPESSAHRKIYATVGEERVYRFSGTGMLLVPGGGVTIIIR